MKTLIINADDFGYSKIFNNEILNLIKSGHVSSTTVLIDHLTKEQKKQVDELIKLKNTKALSVGLHVNFLNDADFNGDIQRQYDKFVLIFGFKPSHMDLHKSIYLNDGGAAIDAFCIKKKIPCRRRLDNLKGIISTEKECINGTTTGVSKIISDIVSSKFSSFEVLFHPGKYDPDCKSSFNRQREEDIEKIKALYEKLKENNIKLTSFYDLPVEPKKTLSTLTQKDAAIKNLKKY